MSIGYGKNNAFYAKNIDFFGAWILAIAVLLGSAPCCASNGDEAPVLYLGADLSYVNEMEDCGAVYREHGQPRDPFILFAERGANLVRVRLWNDPDWTRYSNLEDVKRTIARSRQAGMQVLLDFHYSDDWADGDKQIIPRAWAEIYTDEELAQALYQFTLDTLLELHGADPKTAKNPSAGNAMHCCSMPASARCGISRK